MSSKSVSNCWVLLERRLRQWRPLNVWPSLNRQRTSWEIALYQSPRHLSPYPAPLRSISRPWGLNINDILECFCCFYLKVRELEGGEGRGEREGRREKGEGGREKGEGGREKGEGERGKGEGGRGKGKGEGGRGKGEGGRGKGEGGRGKGGWGRGKEEGRRRKGKGGRRSRRRHSANRCGHPVFTAGKAQQQRSRHMCLTYRVHTRNRCTPKDNDRRVHSTTARSSTASGRG